MTSTAQSIMEEIRAAFQRVPYPGDPFLQGSWDGCEPYDEISHFKGKTEWAALDPEFLDARYCALSFLSEGGFRFFVPAWILADLADALRTADPCFHLTHGFERGPLNPRRYGAIRWDDYARFRLSVFAREEAAAIVEYLRWKQDRSRGEDGEAARIIAIALDRFWLERARSAPTQGELETPLRTLPARPGPR